MGATNNTFGTKGVTENCFFLKQVSDSVQIRERILDILESVSYPDIPDEDARKLLSFCVVGGGPTGVEFCGELTDFLYKDVARYFPGIRDKISVNIIQSADHILNTV